MVLKYVIHYTVNIPLVTLHPPLYDYSIHYIVNTVMLTQEIACILLQSQAGGICVVVGQFGIYLICVKTLLTDPRFHCVGRQWYFGISLMCGGMVVGQFIIVQGWQQSYCVEVAQYAMFLVVDSVCKLFHIVLKYQSFSLMCGGGSVCNVSRSRLGVLQSQSFSSMQCLHSKLRKRS